MRRLSRPVFGLIEMESDATIVVGESRLVCHTWLETSLRSFAREMQWRWRRGRHAFAVGYENQGC